MYATTNDGKKHTSSDPERKSVWPATDGNPMTLVRWSEAVVDFV